MGFVDVSGDPDAPGVAGAGEGAAAAVDGLAPVSASKLQLTQTAASDF
jgi:hypothetical protein